MTNKAKSELKQLAEDYMQRIVEFRGKRKDNGEWVYGYLAGEDLINVWDWDNDKEGEVNTYQVDPKTIGQFIGLEDKNGKEIYEGDIITPSPRYKEVVGYGKHDYAEVVRMKEIEGSDDMGVDCIGYPLFWEDYKIIGNIYENPELREVESENE